jgi:hypothetical protein
MCAITTPEKARKDRVAGELAEQAYPLVLRQGVKATSVDVELGVWKAIEGTLQEVGCSEETPARLTEAVYELALERGFEGPFLDLELDLWKTFDSWGRRRKEAMAVV